MAKFLLGQGAAVNQATQNGATPLYLAAQKGHTETAKLLLEQARQSIKRIISVIPLCFRTHFRGFTETVKLLLTQGAAINQILPDGTTLLSLAVEAGNYRYD